MRRYTLAADGSLTGVADVTQVPFPTYLARRRSTPFGFAVSETTGLDRASFGTDPDQTGRPAAVWFHPGGPAAPGRWTERLSGGELPTHLTMHPSGDWLVVSHYGCDPVPGGIAVLPVDPAGRPAAPSSAVTHHGCGPVTARQSVAHVHSTVFTPDGATLIAADLGADRLVVFTFDAVAGTLQRVGACRTPAGWGPRYLHWSADDRSLFVVGELAGEVGAFAWSSGDEALEFLGSVRTSRTKNGVLPSDLHLAPDADLLYVANRDAAATLAVISCTDPSRMELVAEVPTHGNWPRHFALAPHGRMVVVANQHSNNLSVLRRDDHGVPSQFLSSTAHPAPSFVGFE